MKAGEGTRARCNGARWQAEACGFYNRSLAWRMMIGGELNPGLSLMEKTGQVNLGEGRTPLIPSRRLGPALGFERLYFKVESANPTGSYKDRFAARAVALMRQARTTATSWCDRATRLSSRPVRWLRR